MKKTFTKIIYRLFQNSIFFLAGISFCAGMVVVLSRGDTWEDLGKHRDQNYSKKSRSNPELRREEYNDLVDRGTLWKIIDKNNNNEVDNNEENIILDKEGSVVIAENFQDDDYNFKLYVDGKVKAEKFEGDGIFPSGFCIFSHKVQNCPEGFSKDDAAFNDRTIRAIQDIKELGKKDGIDHHGNSESEGGKRDETHDAPGTNWPPYINVIVCCKD